jgi:hypothetical protein
LERSPGLPLDTGDGSPPEKSQKQKGRAQRARAPCE